MKPVRYCRSQACYWILLLLLGCADIRHAGLASPGDAQSEQEDADIAHQGYHQVRKAAATLLEGIRLYDKGDYQEAIARFDTPEISAAPPALRIESLKYKAFSYCLIASYSRCRQAFDQAFSIDADFDLLPSEGGHPMWGPVFEEAQAAYARHLRAPASRERERWRGIDPWRPR